MDKENAEEKTTESRLTGKHLKLIEHAAAEIKNSYGSFDVIEEEALKVATQAGPLRGQDREFAIERLVIACTEVNQPRKMTKAIITAAFDMADSR